MAAVNMTEGSSPRHLINYSLPLIAGNLFQLTYNVVDSIIAGRFIGKEALAAEGTANPGDEHRDPGDFRYLYGRICADERVFRGGRVREAKAGDVHHGDLRLLFLPGRGRPGRAAGKALLAALNVPEELLDMASTYLRIIFLGAPFTYFYNAVSSALKSVGTPGRL